MVGCYQPMKFTFSREEIERMSSLVWNFSIRGQRDVQEPNCYLLVPGPS